MTKTDEYEGFKASSAFSSHQEDGQQSDNNSAASCDGQEDVYTSEGTIERRCKGVMLGEKISNGNH